MILFSKIKHFVLLSGVLSMIGILAFTLEKSEFTDITNIEIQGNYYLSVEKYLSFAKLNDLEGQKMYSSGRSGPQLASRPSQLAHLRVHQIIKKVPLLYLTA